MINDIDEGFHEALRKVQTQEVGSITEGGEVGEYMSLRIFFRRGLKTEVLKDGLEISVIETNMIKRCA